MFMFRCVCVTGLLCVQVAVLVGESFRDPRANLSVVECLDGILLCSS